MTCVTLLLLCKIAPVYTTLRYHITKRTTPPSSSDILKHVGQGELKERSTGSNDHDADANPPLLVLGLRQDQAISDNRRQSEAVVP
ncbi:hypothetical protein BKA70DRAFT_1339515 [Coprinopsis sp. MPI-PUGE-AT-0042]|nr:hypothetical protein BKA70DRAFT_1339515 [Coprinopsis sp. MPI-PUGE-AT-0042]